MTQPDLQQEAERARYTLRSSFFYRVHFQWTTLLALAGQQAGSSTLKWGQLQDLGISDTAWNRVQDRMINPTLVFCHPEVIQQVPTLITYYRCLALLPQKGLKPFGLSSTKNLEEGGNSNLSRPRAQRIAHVLNNLISLLIESDHNWTLEDARVAALLNFGTQINGSWRNEVGDEGSRRVKELLVGSLLEEGLVENIIKTDGSLVTPSQEVPFVRGIRGITITGGYEITFASEPDVSIRTSQGILESTIEVKYGLDPAGALERYGAAKKSFDEAVRENSRVINVYLASAITPEVRRRMDIDRLVNRDFNLTEVLANSEIRREFIGYVRRLITR